jgi:hypothetical protein
MNKLVFIILFFIPIFNVYSIEITGIGDYKIGMTEDIFLEIPFIKNKRLEDKISSMFKPDEDNLWRTTQISKVDKYQRVYSTDIVKYEFQSPLGITSSISGKDLYWVEVLFFKNILSKINIVDPDSSFEKVLTLKYGKAQYEDKTRKIICQNGFGAKSIHSDGDINYKWINLGKKILAKYSYVFYSCGTVGIIYAVESIEVMKIVSQLEDKIRKEEELKDNLDKANSSKL